MKKFFLFLVVFQVALVSNIGAEIGKDEFSVVNVKDTLSIKVLDNSSLNTNVKVTEDGNINFPYIGAVYVKGRKVKEVEDEITERLADGFVKYPVVTVLLTRGTESQVIYLYGEIGMHGSLPFEDNLTLLKVLSIAGGVSEEGLYGKSRVRRKTNEGYKDVEFSMYDILDSQTGNMLLLPDDMIIIEPGKTFTIEGEVNNPGKYLVEKGMTLRRALSLAGSATVNGFYGRFILRQNTDKGDEDSVFYIDDILYSQAGDILLQPDDMIIVERNRKFIIEGNVKLAGEYPLKKDMTAERALLEAGVIDLYGRVIVRRDEASGYKDIEMYFKGDVRGGSEGDILLQHDDIIIVEKNETFTVYGEVASPGEYDLKKDSTAFTAMLEAGGITKWGSDDRIKILRRNEEVKDGVITIKVKLGDFIKGDISADVAIKPGDILVFSPGML